MVATYESASTRRFKLGRVDCIRSTTMEALEWAQSMQKSVDRSDSTERIRKFHAAVEKQTAIMVENITGEGIDIHLLGLKQQAIEAGIPVPKLLQDETFKIANYFGMSTSQVSQANFLTSQPLGSFQQDVRTILFKFSSYALVL